MTEREEFVRQMEALFGTEEALGVWFRLDNGTRLTLEEYNAQAAAGDMPAASSYLRTGGSAVCCTDYASLIYWALPSRVQIVGFVNEANPTSRIARERIHPGGHDFALIDGRYIVDPWPRFVPMVFDQMVFDLEHEADAALALDIYGPRAYWKPNPVAEEFARQL